MCNLYPHLCLETFPALKLTQNCYLHYNINIFFNTCNLIAKSKIGKQMKHCGETGETPQETVETLEKHNIEGITLLITGKKIAKCISAEYT